MRFAIFFLFLISLATSCVVDEADLSRYMQSKIQNIEQAKDINVVYSDSGYTLFILKAPVSKRLYTRTAVTEEFPEGIEVTFYNKTGQPVSWLTSDFAIRDQANRLITVQKNVLLRNSEGERMDGPELIWDERRKEIYTDRFVKITRADGSVVYSYGFKSNDRFTRYELNAVSGDMNIKALDELKSDSTATTDPPSRPVAPPPDAPENTKRPLIKPIRK
jgi:LPS export ABC transporter protein LptC